jgi:LPS export ABC transporter protein LptC
VMKWYVCLAMALIVASVSLGRLGAWLSARGRRVSLPVAAPGQARDPDIRVQGVRFVEQADAAMALTVSAEVAAWYDVAQFAVVNQVQAQFFPRRAAPLSVEADYGRIASPTGDLNLHGHVRLRHQAGYTLTTEALYWQASKRTLHTDAPVSMHNATVHITGMGLQGEVEQQRFLLQRDVRASFQLRQNAH